MIRRIIVSVLIKYGLLGKAKIIRNNIFQIYSIIIRNLSGNFSFQYKLLPDYYGPRIIYIDPFLIKYDTTSPDWMRNYGSSFIIDGDWDQKHINNMDEKPTFGQRTVHDMFVKGLDYRETEQYHEMVRRLHMGRRPWGCKTMYDIHNYFSELKNIYDDIKNNGFKTQDERGNASEDEVLIYIDRNGRFINGWGGKHRIAIAKILKLQSIPVLVCGVHKQWAAKVFLSFNSDVNSAIDNGLNQICKNG